MNLGYFYWSRIILWFYNLFYISSLENSGVILDNAADKNNPTNLILLIVINDNPASCKRSNFVSIKPVKTIKELMITVIFDLFIIINLKCFCDVFFRFVCNYQVVKADLTHVFVAVHTYM